MTKFDKTKFNFDGMYLTYGEDRRFVARFKNRGGDRAGFQKFLIANFTVEEYFAALDQCKAPAQVLETKGYVSNTVKKILKQTGYTPDAAGKEKYLADQAAKYRKGTT